MTIHLIAFGLALASIFTPTMDPSMMPTMDGTTIIGSTAPWFRYTQAADVSVMESRNLLVATDILSGAPIMRFSTGTFAYPAPRPNMPAMTPMMMNSARPPGVLWMCHSTSLPRTLLGRYP